jgi:hypothetical protein
MSGITKDIQYNLQTHDFFENRSQKTYLLNLSNSYMEIQMS